MKLKNAEVITIEDCNTLIENYKSTIEFFSKKDILWDYCDKHFYQEMQTRIKEKKLNVTGKLYTFFPKREQEYLSKDIFHFVLNRNLLVTYSVSFKQSKSASSKLKQHISYRPIPLLIQTSKRGNLYVLPFGLKNGDNSKVMILMFTSHFFDRLNLRLYDNQLAREKVVAYFIAREKGSRSSIDGTEVKFIWKDGLGLGEVVAEDDKNVFCRINTYITPEMATKKEISEEDSKLWNEEATA